MGKTKTLIAKSVATHLIGFSFILPGTLQRRGFLRAMDRIFSGMAPSYDRAWEKMGTSVVLAPLDRAAGEIPKPPARIADLACGTGPAAFRLADTFPEARITGADISRAMIETFRKKIPPAKRERISALVSPSGRLPFADNTFDLVLTQNAPPYPEEMIRVLRPGGFLFFLYSFAFIAPVRRIVRRRLVPLNLCDITIRRAGEGMAVTAVKGKKGRA
ncbi:MAG: methyltransferase domain-containing protein [Deltaproteobacteria bacterium]|nr:methyltransferase domain-containing protein [Deltaproteobacteria bacterium]